MDNLLANLNITVNENLYVKNPETTDLGKKIIEHSILLIHEIGFEAFTFKKLGEKIQSNESSIYRYFESKHKLLLYLSSWYWSWIEYKLAFATTNISDPIEKLSNAIIVVTEEIKDDISTRHINESILNKIIICEFTKTFLTKEVDEENKKGFFLVYQSVVNRIITMIEEVNPNYKYAKTLASSIVEGSLHQHYLKEHFQNITNLSESNCLPAFYIDLIKKTLL
ncbi:TetR/AcrR family transcriptional regulator [Flavobacterium sp. J27]|uniref:TetR/AcrR family transcriptional regulator n=1 Tax=Flavobacterium sp. J27 TaxID=2060419 RepID=UPI00102F34E7|nr:TetR/AcrR family transcriptional regulator [Flavobacterium sp. J27]